MSHRLTYASKGPWNLEHGSVVPGDFNRIRRDGLLTDVVLTVRDRSFFAHKVVLAATSPYFQGAFSSGLAESRGDKMELHNVEPHILDEMLSFMYTGKAKIQGFDQALDMLVAADQFLMTDLARLTLQLIKLRAARMDFPKLLAEASRYHIDDLEAFAFVRYLQYFDDFPETLPHLPYKLVYRVLSSDFIVLKGEWQVLDAVLRWFETNCHPDSGAVVSVDEKSTLISTVRFSHIDPEWLPGFWPRLAPHCQEFSSAQHILCGLGRAGGEPELPRWILRDATPAELGQDLFEFAIQHYEYGGIAALVTLIECPDHREQVRKHVVTLLQDAFDESVNYKKTDGDSIEPCARSWNLLPWAGLVPSMIIEDLLPFKSVRRSLCPFLAEEIHEESQVLMFDTAYAIVLRCNGCNGELDTVRAVNARACMEELVTVMQDQIQVASHQWVQLLLQKAAQKIHNVLSLSATSPTSQ